MIAAAVAGCNGTAESNVTDEPLPTHEPTITSNQTALPTSVPVTPSPFEHPTTEATEESTREHPHASANVVYQIADNTLMSYITTTGESWVFTGMNFPIWPAQRGVSSMDTNIYALARPDELELQLFEITPVMTRPLTIYAEGDLYGVAAVTEPNTPNIWLAIGLKHYSDELLTSRLVLQTVDSTTGNIVAEQVTQEHYYYSPVRWSADAKRLYYSQEPDGLGGYILFDGWSSLYVYDVAAATSRDLLPIDLAQRTICLDDLSPDEQWVVHHCTQGAGIGLYSLATGEQGSMIALPAGIHEVGQLGSARFSPDGNRIAFAMARSWTDEEQGWVAVTDDLAGTSRLLLTSEPHSYYNVKAWLDEHTILVQEYRLNGGELLWLVPIDGGEPILIGEGVYITLIPALVP